MACYTLIYTNEAEANLKLLFRILKLVNNLSSLNKECHKHDSGLETGSQLA